MTDRITASPLSPCPVCNGRAIIYSHNIERGWLAPGCANKRCKGSGFFTFGKRTESEAEQRWNNLIALMRRNLLSRDTHHD